MVEASPKGSTDGRHERTRKHRQALVEAMVALVRETGAPPIAEEVAERAGVSRRTVFRLFEDMDTIHQAAREHLQAEVAERFPTPDFADKHGAARIDTFVDHITTVYEFVSPLRLLAERQRSGVPAIENQLREEAAELRRKLGRLFAELLQPLEPPERKARLSNLVLLCEWRAYNSLRQQQGASLKQTRLTLRIGIKRLLID